MPQFQYEGVDKAGKKVAGVLDAPNEGEMRMSLRNLGIRPTVVKAARAPGSPSMSGFLGGGPRIKSEVLVAFTRQLHALIGAGVPLVQSLEVLGEQSHDRTLRTVILSIKEKVSAGSYFWESIAAYPTIFPKLFIALIRAGESSGSLDQMLKRLSRYLEDSQRIKRMVKGAMFYPIAVVAVGFGVILLMLMFVIPKFEEMLKGSGQALPLPTQIVMSASHFVAENGVFILGGTSIFIFLAIRYAGSNEGRAFLDRLFYPLPIFGTILQKSGVAKFARTLHTLLASGVNLIDALDICRTTVDNAVVEDAVSKIRAEVEEGKPLALVVSKLPVFPKMTVQMIHVGESTGSLDKMLEKVADFYEEEVETLIGSMTKLLEPLILVVLGGLVAGMLISMYLPVFQMAGSA